MGYSKWIFGSIGFALSGTPIGAMIGFALGSLFDNATVVTKRGDAASTTDQRRVDGRQATAGDLAISLVVLSAAVMKADGKVTQGELGHVKRFFNQQFGPQHSAELLRLLRDVLRKEIPLRDVCEQVRGHLKPAERSQLMHYLVGLAYADGHMDTSERHVLERIASYLGVSEGDLASLNAMFHKSTPSVAYEILEVDAKASDEEVKKAYRRAAMKHHPDKVAHLGEEFQRAASEKFKSVQQAWERVRKERGM